MKVTSTQIEDVKIIEPTVHGDERGYFFESYTKNIFEKALGCSLNFVQDNESKSKHGVLRGLHYQIGEFAQAKLVRVIAGEILDIAVDLRRKSKTFQQHVSVILSAHNKSQLFIPRGFAHGFIVLSEFAQFIYKVDNYYSPENEAGIRFSDTELNIDWKVESAKIIVSEKDARLPRMKEIHF